MSATDELSYATSSSNCIDASTTTILIPDSDSEFVAIVCGEEQVKISCKDLFKLLKWAYRQWGGEQ